MMKIGYTRVSTDEQTLDLQIDALKKAGCIKIFTDKGVSALKVGRRGFDQALNALGSGDQLVGWKMDRGFRSLRHAMDVFDEFERRGIEFRELTEGIDTSTPMGKCFFQIRNAFAELERNLISERTRAGMQAAKKRGIHSRRPFLLREKQIENAMERIANGETKASIAKGFHVNIRTLSRAIARFSEPDSANLKNSLTLR